MDILKRLPRSYTEFIKFKIQNDTNFLEDLSHNQFKNWVDQNVDWLLRHDILSVYKVTQSALFLDFNNTRFAIISFESQYESIKNSVTSYMQSEYENFL